jgi:hypothetical protein
VSSPIGRRSEAGTWSWTNSAITAGESGSARLVSRVAGAQNQRARPVWRPNAATFQTACMIAALSAIGRDASRVAGAGVDVAGGFAHATAATAVVANASVTVLMETSFAAGRECVPPQHLAFQ